MSDPGVQRRVLNWGRIALIVAAVAALVAVVPPLQMRVMTAAADAPNLAIPVVQPAAGSISNRACVALSGPGRVDSNAANDCQTVGNASTATSATSQAGSITRSTSFQENQSVTGVRMMPKDSCSPVLASFPPQ